MYSKQDFEIDGYVGILSLGLGDSMASIFGKLFGRRKWFLTKKTAEGSWLVVAMQWTTLGSAFWKYVMVVVLTGIYEGISEQNDNIMVPLIFWAGTQAIRR
ncbi:Dolichol kinase sec59 [Neolecta irregularis DAH-3]|uniref:dolichol kinase n=1 Tax=Neolecta irregularis (strain DAH-3) TaxID=1198029 RepID=A0A1U7LSR1_NEOID|nr:Dolichol kinase sec59 [Neolecta irregularis DAH-3]|eukprot:OLL25710.1 Dolichol kinase sec59 [Neolecta irregularis DAH-3]